MSSSTFKRWFTLASICIFLLIILLPFDMLPRTAFAQASTVSMNPSQGAAGIQVTGTGSNWVVGDAMLIQWEDGTNLATTTVQSGGTFTVNFTVPSNATLGNHTVYFVDQTASYFIPSTFTVGTIDLQTLNIVALQPPTAGSSPTFRANIKNNGTVASGGFNIQWIVDGSSIYGGHYSIPAGAVDTHDHIWNNITLGQHTLTFIANYDHSIPETNYTNNQVTITFTVSPQTTFTYPFALSNVNFKIGYDLQNPSLPGLNGCYYDSSKSQYVPFKQLWHSGEDWFAKSAAGSTTISAVANGIVKYVSPKSYSYPGTVIIIQHTLSDNSLIYSMYGHLDPNKILVKVNATVTKGQAIAGGLIPQKSGGGDNTHLHWEIRYFLDGSGITRGPAYKNSCSGMAAPGYTWPGQPDNFVFNGTTYRWTNPSNFIATHM